MAKGLPRSLARGNALDQELIKVKELVSVASFVINDPAAAVGWGTAVLRGLPQGNIALLGAVAYATLTAGAGGIIDAFVGDFSIGSAPSTDNSALTGALDDVVPSTALAAATGGVSPKTRAASIGADAGTILDNTDGSLELNLNVLIDDTSIAAADTMTGEVEIYLAFTVLGDD